MAAAQKPTDVFMQFASWSLTWAPVTTTVVEEPKNTGLSVRGGLMWIIHMIDITGVFVPIVHGNTIFACLSTVSGATVQPTAGDKGYLGGFSHTLSAPAAGATNSSLPESIHYLPPVPVASPNISGYISGEFDDTSLDGRTMHIRVGYTTTPLDAKSYAEIAETWAQV